jgi:hypothetical protein
MAKRFRLSGYQLLKLRTGLRRSIRGSGNESKLAVCIWIYVQILPFRFVEELLRVREIETVESKTYAILTFAEERL